LATSAVFPSPPRATKVRTWGREEGGMRSAGPRGVEELEFVVAPDELGGGVLEDTGDVGLEVSANCLRTLSLGA
jgi:hypothetical protein